MFFLHIFTIIINVIRGKKVKNLCKYIPIGIITIILIFSAPSTLAFSGYGSGTSKNNPYFITNCSQLQEINNDLTGYYVLASNIDCTGFAFVHLANSTPFSGTLDGQNHVVKNINFDNYGLFQSTDGATIKNIFLDSGSVSGDYYVGSVVGHANNSIISNVHSSIDVEAVSYSGGLVGSSTGNTSVTKSSYSGNLTGQAYSGGLVGAMWDSGTSITDSFVDGTVHAYSPYVGALVGGFFNGVINRVYSSATIDTGANHYVGGLVGDDQGVVSNSFSATTLSAATSYYGGLVGLDVSGTYDNDFIDGYLSGSINWCSGSGDLPGCTMVNSDNNESNYFKNNSINAPFETWDFNEIWQTTPGYPTLRDIALFSDPAGIPNNGDANNDGIQDSYQANLSSQIDPTTGKYAVLESSCELNYNVQVGGEASGSSSDANFSYPAGLIGFTTFCAPGATATITEYFYGSFEASKLVMHNWDGANTYTTIPGAKLTNITIAGQPVLKVVYQITDGGALDNYQPANGVIKMISGPAIATASAPVTGFGNHHGNTKLTIAEYSLAGIAILSIVYMNRKYLKR